MPSNDHLLEIDRLKQILQIDINRELEVKNRGWNYSTQSLAIFQVKAHYVIASTLDMITINLKRFRSTVNERPMRGN